MTREETINEINKVFEPAFANYIVEALTMEKTNATNGEVIKALFPDVRTSNAAPIRILGGLDGLSHRFEARWWNSPYKQTDTTVCNGCKYFDGEVHAECVVCDKEGRV